MASIRKEMSLKTAADTVWDAIRDFPQVHIRVAPGFLADLTMDKGDRVIAFGNGVVARERLVTIDNADKRFVYSIVDGRPTHHNASFQVIPTAEGGCRVVWTADLLPDDLAPAVAEMMDAGLGAMKKKLDT